MSRRRSVAPLLVASLIAAAGGSARADVSLLVSSSGDGEVLRYNATTGAYLGVFAQDPGTPSGLTYGLDGNLYVTNLSTSTVEQYNGTTGAFLSEFIPSSGGLQFPHAITTGSDGNLYVASGETDSIREYSGTDGHFLGTFASGSGLSRPTGLVFHAGNLFVSSSGTNQILEFNGTTGAFIGVFASGHGLNGPAGLAFDALGDLYVANFQADNVLEFGPTGNALGVFASGSGLGEAAAVAFGPDGNLYVTSYDTSSILVFDGTSGSYLRTFASGGALDNPLALLFTSAPVPEPSALRSSASELACRSSPAPGRGGARGRRGRRGRGHRPSCRRGRPQARRRRPPRPRRPSRQVSGPSRGQTHRTTRPGRSAIVGSPFGPSISPADSTQAGPRRSTTDRLRVASHGCWAAIFESGSPWVARTVRHPGAEGTGGRRGTGPPSGPRRSRASRRSATRTADRPGHPATTDRSGHSSYGCCRKSSKVDAGLNSGFRSDTLRHALMELSIAHDGGLRDEFPRLALRLAPALGLVALLSASASAQTNYLAVSEVSGGTNGLGQVAVYQQNSDGSLASTTPYATITTASGLVNPMGLAFNATTGDLYIAGLGTSQIIDFNVNTQTASTFATSVAGYGNLGGLAISGNNLFVSAYNGGTTASPGAVLEYSLTNPGAGPTIFQDGTKVVGPTGLAVNGSTVYVNSSQTGLLYSINTATPATPFTQATFSGGPSTAAPLSAPAGMTFGSPDGGASTYLYETNFFSKYGGSSYTVGIQSYGAGGAAGPGSDTTGGYSNPALGGPADLVFGPGVVTNFGPQVLVSDYGDGLIYQYGAGPAGDLNSQSTYLSGISPPTYLAEFATAATFAGNYVVPEPASVALLVLGGAAGLLGRRLLRARAPRRAARPGVARTVPRPGRAATRGPRGRPSAGRVPGPPVPPAPGRKTVRATHGPGTGRTGGNRVARTVRRPGRAATGGLGRRPPITSCASGTRTEDRPGHPGSVDRYRAGANVPHSGQPTVTPTSRPAS